MPRNRVIIPLLLFAVLSIVLIPALACDLSDVSGDATKTPTPTKEVKTTPYQFDLNGKVIVDTAPVRSGPGLKFDQLGTLKKDTKITITGISSDLNWYRIKTPAGIDNKGKETWISTLFAQQTAP